MKHLHIATAFLEIGAGLALICCPSFMVELLVGTLLDEPAALVVARIGGAGLLTLGLACWQARVETECCAARGLIAAIVFYNIATVVFLAYASIRWQLHGVALWPAVALHVVMAFWCIASLYLSPPRESQR